MSHWKTNFPRGQPAIRYVNEDTASTGTVTNIATGYGISGGPITSTGTLTANLSSLTRHANQNVAVAAGGTILYPNSITNALETQGSVTYDNGTGRFTINTTGLYEITVTAMHNGVSTARIACFIRKNADALLHKVMAGWNSSTLTITLSLVATDFVFVSVQDAGFTTPAADATNYITIKRLA